MLPLGERVILVTASPPIGDSPASIKYSLAEMYEAGSESAEISTTDLIISNSSDVDPLLTDSWPESVFCPMESVSRLHSSRQMSSRSYVADLTESKMHFALSGGTLDIIRKFCPELLPKILCRGTVFARMSPDQKTKVPENFFSKSRSKILWNSFKNSEQVYFEKVSLVLYRMLCYDISISWWIQSNKQVPKKKNS